MIVDDPLDAVLRCTKFSCHLTHRACLRRQTEVKRFSATHKERPVYEWCASGECDQGNEVAVMHPEFEAMKAREKRSAPRLDVIQSVEERHTKGEDMPKVEKLKRGQPKPCCGSRSSRHTAECKLGATVKDRALAPKVDRLAKLKAAGEKTSSPPAAVEKAVRAVINEAPSNQIARMADDELLVWRSLIAEELVRRERTLTARLAEMRKSLGFGSGAEEAA